MVADLNHNQTFLGYYVLMANYRISTDSDARVSTSSVLRILTIGSPTSAIAIILAGSLLGLSFHASELTPLSWAGLILVAVLVRGGDLKIIPAYVAGITFHLVGLSWMTTCYSSVALTENRIIIWLGLSLYFGLIFPIVILLGCQLRKYWAMWVVMPVIWTAGDLLRFESGRLIVGPFSWLTLGYSQTGFITGCQAADLGGVWAVGFLAAMFGGAVADAINDRRLPVIPLLLLLAATAYGATRIYTSDLLGGPTVALMPARETDVPRAAIALWSETAFEQHEPLTTSCTTIQGCRRYDGDKIFNAAVVNTRDFSVCYDKCNIVPYFESSFSPGDRPVSFESDGHQVGVAICYDISFGRFMREFADCDFTVVLGNESFDPTMQLANQMLAMGKIRAIEMRRTLVRNVDGGYSGTIDGNGHALPIELTEPTIVSVPLDGRLAVYPLLGDWLPIVCILAALVAICRGSRLQSVPRIAVNVVDHEANRTIAK